MFASKDIFLKSSGGGYQISRSVRLRSSASASLTRTPASATNRRTFTLSAWIKRGIVNAGTSPHQFLYSASTSSTFNAIDLYANNIRVNFGNGTYLLVTNALYRDPAAWYHIVLAVDTTQATSTNRVLLYVNGVQVTSFSTASYPTQNYDTSYNNTVAQRFGVSDGSDYFDGYLTEINFIDGQALTPSSFGETNATTGVWQSKKYAGTYGTNGFYLNFSDNSTAAALGTDFSGNGNNWTPNNISVTAGVTYDSMLDVPTPYADGGNGRGNYAVLNPVDLGYSATLSEANLKVSTASSGNAASASTMALSTNTYWEVTIGSNSQVGLIWGRASDAYGNSSISMFANGATGSLGNATRTLSATPSWSNGDTLGLAWNSSTRVLTLYQAGSATAVMTILTPATGDPQAVVTNYTSGSAMSSQVNFGQRPFSYTPPTGFVALNTQNLPTPTISNGANYMAATTYTGTGSSLTIANNVGSASFQPDLVWVKGRSGATDHALYDAVRGVQKQLESNQTGAETTETTGLTAFGSTGFTVGALAQMNTSAATYVAWQWNAGGSTVTNTSGSISSQVRANATAGFSVVTWTGAGSAGTIGHGLGVTPSMIIIKNRSGTQFWFVNHTSISATQNLYLNDTAAVQSDGIFTSRGATTFGVGTGVADSGINYVAYCFAAVAGYSAFGSYTGNGSTDGPFVFTNFRPRWVMIKRTDANENWQMYDTSRNTSNVVGEYLLANSSGAGATITVLDFLSNGFKIRVDGTNPGVNTSGGTYVYAAFSENPFKNSLAR